MKRRAFFGLFGAAPAAIALPAATPVVPLVPDELSDAARIQHREHMARNAMAHLHDERVRFIARSGQ